MELRELGLGVQAVASLLSLPLSQGELKLNRREENMDMKKGMYQEVRNRTQAPILELGLNNSNQMMEN